jgi:DHA1 family tetracycline resistance protein-like MFS transporter
MLRSLRAPRAGLVFIAITVCLDVISQSITFPILPRLVEQLLHGDRPAAARWVGVLEAAWALAQFIAAPALGMLSDRFGRRPVIIISVAGVAAEFVMAALAPTVEWLMAARVLCGLTCGAQAAAMAYVADVVPPDDRTKNFGWLNAAAWTGVVLGPALGGMLGAVDLRGPFWAAAAFAALNAVYGWLVLPESLPDRDRPPWRWSKANPWGALGLLASRPGLLALGGVMLLLWLALHAMNSVLVLYTAYRYGWTPWAFGVFATAFALINIGVQSRLAGWVAERLRERRTVLAGLTAQAVAYTAVSLAPLGWIYWISNIPLALGNVAGPALQTLMTEKVGPDEQGRLQGAIGAISCIAGLMGPIAFTQLFAWTIAPSRGGLWSGLPIFLGAILTVAAMGLVAAFARDAPKTEVAQAAE